MITIKELNDYLKEIVTNCDKCSQCQRNHYNTCFFAYECIKDNFNLCTTGKSKRLTNKD